jgi:hypothetical protein
MSNPADYFMTIMSAEDPNEDISENDDEDDDNGKPKKSDAQIHREYTKKINFFVEQYNKSELKNDYAYVSKDVAPIHSTEIYSATAGWCTQLGLLTKRSFNNIIRLPEVLILRYGGLVACAICIDIIFQRLKGNSMGV